MTPGLVADLCKPHDKKTFSATSDIPADALFITAEYSDSLQCFRVIFEHYSFEDIPEGSRIPRKEGPKFTTYFKTVAEG